MILVVTNRSDLTADWLILELERRQEPFARFNTEDYPQEATISWRTRGATIAFADREVDMQLVRAVWFRRPSPPQPPVDVSPERGQWLVREAREALEGIWRTHEGLWVNRPERNLLASVKPEQLKRAEQLGFTVPVSLVTNDAAAAADFLAEHAEAVCKPLYSGRVADGDDEHLFFTTLLSEPARAAATELGPEPYLFQVHVPKRYDVRVTVIGGDVFAARIDSQRDDDDGRVDWRRAAPGTLAHSVEELPDEVAGKCLALARDYGLEFAAIDLARRDDGDYVFFEVNPNGQWAWIEQLTGLPLRARLGDLLAAG